MSAVVSVCAGAAIADPPNKIKDFFAAGAGETESPDADGIYMAKYDEVTNFTSHHLVMHELVPYTTYGVQVNSLSGAEFPNSVSGFTAPVAFTTNHKGKGMFDVQFPFNSSVDPVVLVFVWDGAMMVDPITGDLMLDLDALDVVTEQELRAIGVASF